MQSARAHYVPILVTKRGELGAIEDLSEETKDQFTPLFAAHPVGWNYETEAPVKSVTDHVVGLGNKLARAYGVRRAYFDPVFLIEDAEWDPSNPHPLLTVVGDAAGEGLQLVPVFAPGRHPSYTNAVVQVHRDTNTGVCLRLSPGDWPANPHAAADLDDLLKTLGVDPGETDLVLDVAEHANNEVVTGLIFAVLASLPHAYDWRSVTLTSGAFPRDLSGIPRNTVSRIPRLDWQLWASICGEAQDEGWRVPDFGDYAVSHPDPVVSVDPRMMSISASIRYTASTEWLIAKGELFKGRGGTGVGGDAAVAAAQMLVDAPEYCGPRYSAGDRWISQVATAEIRGGNPERWRRVATNHHLVFVTESLAISGDS